MVRYVTNTVLLPNDRMVIVGFELLSDELCPGIDRLQLLLTEHVG